MNNSNGVASNEVTVMYRNFDVGFANPLSGDCILASLSIPTCKGNYYPPDLIGLPSQYEADCVKKSDITIANDMAERWKIFFQKHEKEDQFTTGGFTYDHLVAEAVVLRNAKNPSQLSTLTKNVLYTHHDDYDFWPDYIKKLSDKEKEICVAFDKADKIGNAGIRAVSRKNIMKTFLGSPSELNKALMVNSLISNMKLIGSITNWVSEKDPHITRIDSESADFPF